MVHARLVASQLPTPDFSLVRVLRRCVQLSDTVVSTVTTRPRSRNLKTSVLLCCYRTQAALRRPWNAVPWRQLVVLPRRPLDCRTDVRADASTRRLRVCALAFLLRRRRALPAT